MGLPVRRSYADLAGGQLHLRRCGEGSPLLLLHESPASGAMWEPLMPILAQAGHAVVAPDLPGFGCSFAFRSPPAIADYALAMLEFADSLGWRRFDVLGHHTGAAVGLCMATEDPQRVSRLVLWGIPLLEDDLRARLSAETVPGFDDEGKEVAALWARRRRLAGPAYSEALGLRCMTEALQCGFTRPWAHWAVARTDMTTLLSAVRQPALALCGPRDPAWPRAREAAALLPRGRFGEIEQAGLDVASSHTRRLAELTLAFLSEG